MRRKDREVAGTAEIRKILDGCRTACVSMIDGDRPYVVPLSYGYDLDGGRLVLYFHCAKQGRKVDVLKKNPKVCFTVFSEGEPVHADTPCNSGYYFSSVIGNGTAEFIEDTEEQRYALGAMFAHQTGDAAVFTEKQAGTVAVFKIVSDDFTGKRKPKPE